MKNTGHLELDTMIDAWRDSGRVAWVYQRQRRISLNGGASKTYQDTLITLSEWKKNNLDDNTGTAIRKRVWGALNRSEQECRNRLELERGVGATSE